MTGKKRVGSRRADGSYTGSAVGRCDAAAAPNACRGSPLYRTGCLLEHFFHYLTEERASKRATERHGRCVLLFLRLLRRCCIRSNKPLCKQCSEAIRLRLERDGLSLRDLTAVLEVASQQPAGSKGVLAPVNMGDGSEEDDLGQLDFDSSFEGGNLGVAQVRGESGLAVCLPRERGRSRISVWERADAVSRSTHAEQAVSPWEYELFVRPDLNAPRYRLWFHFQAKSGENVYVRVSKAARAPVIAEDET